MLRRAHDLDRHLAALLGLGLRSCVGNDSCRRPSRCRRRQRSSQDTAVHRAETTGAQRGTEREGQPRTKPCQAAHEALAMEGLADAQAGKSLLEVLACHLLEVSDRECLPEQFRPYFRDHHRRDTGGARPKVDRAQDAGGPLTSAPAAMKASAYWCSCVARRNSSTSAIGRAGPPPSL
jgi:hypothetical protein